MHPVVAFALPFRMPDFFMISGLFLANVIDRDWRTYLDRKVVHFAYFYLLWMTIQFAVKAPAMAADGGYVEVARLYLVVADRSVRHAVVHLHAAGLLRLYQAYPSRAGAGDLARSAPRWKSRRSQHRLDGAGRIRRALRLLLHWLYARALCLRARRARARASRCSRVAGLLAWGLVNGALVYFGTTSRCRSSRSRSASSAPARW